MSVEEIEAAISELSDQDLAKLVSWFADHIHAEWDLQIEQDLKAGRLDAFIKDSEEDYDAGRAKPL